MTTLAALVTGTTETIPSSIASTEPPLVVSQPAPTSSVSAALVTAIVIDTETVVAPILIESALEPQGLATTTTLEPHLADPAIETAE